MSELSGVPASDVFVRKGGVLHVEGVPLPALAEELDTPTWVYAGSRIDAAYRGVAEAMKQATDRDVLIAYAIKANANLARAKQIAIMR